MRIIIQVCFLLIAIKVAAQDHLQIIPLHNAHAHNDYKHDRPLFDALDQGFTSVEADVYLVDGELYVYHDLPNKIDPSRTLKKMYLDPLLLISRQSGGKVYAGYDVTFYLMIDIKREGEKVYELLKKQLTDYKEMLTSYEGITMEQGAVTIFLSGDRPINQLMSEEKRLMALDGRPSDIGKGIHPSYMPVISDNYNKHFKWKGKTDEMPYEDWRKLRMLIGNAHSEGKKVRFWASPERESVWKVLLRAQVDFINTDRLKGLKVFLQKK